MRCQPRAPSRRGRKGSAADTGSDTDPTGLAGRSEKQSGHSPDGPFTNMR